MATLVLREPAADMACRTHITPVELFLVLASNVFKPELGYSVHDIMHNLETVQLSNRGSAILLSSTGFYRPASKCCSCPRHMISERFMLFEICITFRFTLSCKMGPLISHRDGLGMRLGCFSPLVMTREGDKKCGYCESRFSCLSLPFLLFLRVCYVLLVYEVAVRRALTLTYRGD